MFTDQDLRALLLTCGDSISMAQFISQNAETDQLPRLTNATVLANKIRSVLNERAKKVSEEEKAHREFKPEAVEA